MGRPDDHFDHNTDHNNHPVRKNQLDFTFKSEDDADCLTFEAK